MLKYIGLFVFASCFIIGLQASPTTVCNTAVQETTFLMDLEENPSCIPQATLNLLMKKGAEAFEVNYPDMCLAYDKGLLTIDSTPMGNGVTSYTLTFQGCAVCVFDTDL